MHESVNAAIEPLKRMLEQTGSKAVFGGPIRAGVVTVIPVAEASFLFGGGIGFYPGAPADTDGQDARNGAGVDGAGGGYAGRVKPQGYIVISAEDARYEPLQDPTRRTLLAMVLSAGAVATLLAAVCAGSWLWPRSVCSFHGKGGEYLGKSVVEEATPAGGGKNISSYLNTLGAAVKRHHDGHGWPMRLDRDERTRLYLWPHTRRLTRLFQRARVYPAFIYLVRSGGCTV
jgi:uncharacterized spore protein YtfJ